MKILIYARAWAVLLLLVLNAQNSSGQIEWKKIPFPDTTFVHFIEQFSDSIFVGTHTGLLLSIDKGNNWDTLIELPNVTSIAFFNQKYYIGSLFHGIFRSQDIRSWEPIGDVETLHTRSLLATEGDLFVSTSRAIFKWDEENLKWIKATLDNKCIHNNAIHGIFQVANELYTIGSNYTYKSDLAGEEWIHVKGFYTNQSLKAKEIIDDQIVFSSGPEMFELVGDSIIPFNVFSRPDTNTFVKDFILFDNSLIYTSGEEIMLSDGNFQNVCNSGLTTLSAVNNSLWIGTINKGIWSIDSTGILDQRSSSLADIKLYPNPSDGNISVALTFDHLKPCIFSIVSLDGKLIYTENLMDSKSGFALREINIEVPGNYIAVLENQGQKILTHFIIQ